MPLARSPLGTVAAHRDAAVLAALLLLALLLRLHGIGDSLWHDEVWSARTVLRDWAALWQAVASDHHPPLYPLFMFAWTTTFGDSEVALRLPALLAGLGAVTATHALSRHLDSIATARLATLALAVSPVHVWYSREARPYSFNLLLVLLAALAYHRLETTPPDGPSTRRWLGVFGGCLAGACLSHHYLAVLPAVFAGLATASRHPHAARLRRLCLLALAAPALFLAVRQLTFPEAPLAHLRTFSLAEAWHLHFRWFLHGNTLEPQVPGAGGTWPAWPDVLLGGLGLAAVGHGWWRLPRRTAAHLAAYLLVLPAAIWLLTLATGAPLYVERSLVTGLPFFWIAVASGLRLRRPGWRRTAVAALLVLLAAALVAFASEPQRWTVYKPRADWRAATAALIAEARREGPAPVALIAVPALELDYYREKLCTAGAGAGSGREGCAWRVQRVAPGEPLCGPLAPQPLALIENRWWSGATDEALAGLRADPSCRETGTQRLPGITIYHFATAAPGR